jgi:hypothetical protein
MACAYMKWKQKWKSTLDNMKKADPPLLFHLPPPSNGNGITANPES